MALVPSLLNFISGPESGGRYDVGYGGVTLPSNMSVGDALAWGKKHGRKTGSSALGKYQFINKTLQGLVDELGVSSDTAFTPELQDKLATQLLKRRGLDKFQAGKLSPEAFGKNLSMEWAGLPKDASNRSYYAGDSMGNKAGVKWNDVMSVLGGKQNVSPENVIPDVRMASLDGGMTTGSTNPMDVTGDPVTGQMDLPGLPPVEDRNPGGSSMFNNIPPEILTQMLEPQADPWNNPFLQMGLGILAAPGNYGDAMSGIGQGMAMGMRNYGAGRSKPTSMLELMKADYALGNLEESRLERKEKKTAAEQAKLRQQQMADTFRQQGDETRAQMIESGMTKEAFTQDKTVNVKDPNTGEDVTFAQDPITGEMTRLSPEMDPNAPAKQTPEDWDQDLTQAVQSGQIDYKDALQEQRQRSQVRETREVKFYEDMQKETAPQRAVLDNWNNLETISDADLRDKDNKTVDAELVKRYNKMVLPNEAVMSDDMRIIVGANQGAIEEYTRRMKNGGKLTPEERIDMVERMEKLAKQADQELGRKRGTYEDRLKLYPEMDADRVFFGQPRQFNEHPALATRRKKDTLAEMAQMKRDLMKKQAAQVTPPAAAPAVSESMFDFFGP